MKLGPNQQVLVAALASGQYPKCIGVLQSGDKFCAIGVACKVYEQETGQQLPRRPSRDELDGHMLLGPRAAVMHFFGFRDPRGGDMAMLNDLRWSLCSCDPRYTHKELADMAVEEPEKFFSESA